MNFTFFVFCFVLFCFGVILTFARHSWPLSSEGYWACRTYCGTGKLFIMVRRQVTLTLVAELFPGLQYIIIQANFIFLTFVLWTKSGDFECVVFFISCLFLYKWWFIEHHPVAPWNRNVDAWVPSHLQPNTKLPLLF